MATTVFSRLRIEGWRQFDDVDIELHPRLTVLTGANGAGKTTLLRIFSRHFGFDKPYLSTPRLNKAGTLEYIESLFASLFSKIKFNRPTLQNIGELTYSNGSAAAINMNAGGGVQYHLDISNQQPIDGIHIDSHQAVSFYQVVGQIPTSAISIETAYQHYNAEIQTRFGGGYTQHSPTYRMK